MSTIRPVERRPRRRRTFPWRPVFWLLSVAVAFAVGIALGMALHDNPQPGVTNTSIKTLNP